MSDKDIEKAVGADRIILIMEMAGDLIESQRQEIERLQRDYAQLLERWKEEQALRIQAQAGGSDDSQGSV